jgi:hypothetical protein
MSKRENRPGRGEVRFTRDFSPKTQVSPQNSHTLQFPPFTATRLVEKSLDHPSENQSLGHHKKTGNMQKS